jgi:hypothetical protein
MEFRLIKENEDGSADYNLHVTAEETSDIIRAVIMKALWEAAKEGALHDPGKLDVGDSTSGGEDSVHGSGEQSSEPEQPADGFKTSQVLG